MLTISSTVTFPLCLMFFWFFLSLSGSLRILMIRTEADVATQFGLLCFEWSRPLQSLDPSSHWLLWWCHHQTLLETDSEDRSWWPEQTWHWFPHWGTWGTQFNIVGVEQEWYVGGSWCQMNQDARRPKKVVPWLPLGQKLKAAFYYRFVYIF